MIIFQKVTDLKKYLLSEKTAGKSIGFVPTMGALHEGHISIIHKSKQENDITVSSIFVNPTQFNNQEDFNKYPSTIGKDIEMLEVENCDVLFLPTVKEMYPDGTQFNLNFEVGYLDTVMEGSHRPRHFKGVAQVVKRLLDIVEPHVFYLGQKDFQQFKVVEKMIRDLNLRVELRMAETVREADGLAMSSRNRRLDAETRNNAAVIYSVLKNAISQIHKKSVQEIKAEAIQTLSAIPGAQPEYFEVADADSLTLLSSVEGNERIVICTAIWLNGVRLIDCIFNANA